MESLLNWGMWLVLMIVLIWVYQKKADKSEKHIGWKIIGYYILGAFTFRFNEVVIPIGILIFLVFFLPKLIQNDSAKKWAATIGVANLLMGMGVNYWIYEKDIKVKASSENVYHMNFLQDYAKIKRTLHADENPSINNFDLSFTKDGKVDNMFYHVFYSKDGKSMQASVVLRESGTYLISRDKTNNDQGLFYNNSEIISEPDLYFKAIDKHGLKKLLPKGDRYIVSFNSDMSIVEGEVSLGDQGSLYEINKAEIVKIPTKKKTEDEENEESFPYQIRIMGMKQESEGSYSSDQFRYYTISPELYE